VAIGSALGALLIAALCVWRIRCIGTGPDPDTDAYGHFVIARQFLETPGDLAIHWVWLPLYHLLLAAGIALGAGLDQVRYANALLSTATPLLLWWGVARLPARAGESFEARWLPPLAGAFAAAAPIVVTMGTTAQPESLFALLVLGAALLLALEHHAWAAVVLCAAVLLRYEAWAAAAGAAGLLLWRRWKGAPLSHGALACLVAPGLSVLTWALLRRLDGEQWFGFLRQNQSFAEAARAQAPALGWSEIARGLEAAPLWAWSLGLASLLCGLPRTWRQTSAWFVLLPLSIAAFLVLGWLTRSHLGLTRHWVCLVPFAALGAANGIAQIAECLGRLRRQAQAPVFFALALLVLGLELRTLSEPLAQWRARTAEALLDRRDAGRFLRSVPADVLIVCDDAAAEVLSELPSARFRRNYLGADAPGEIRRWARSSELIVLSAAERLRAALPLGELVYGDPAGTGLVGLRVRRTAGTF
jgi:hypothetical protein